MARREDYELNRSGDNVANLLNKVDRLAMVAITGSYNDLRDTPGPPQSDVFWAIYGTTTVREINQALSEGKIVICKYNETTYLPYVGKTDAYILFGAWDSQTFTLTRITIASGAWGHFIYTPEYKSNISQSVATDSTSTTKYPSGKLESLPTPRRETSLSQAHKRHILWK